MSERRAALRRACAGAVLATAETVRGAARMPSDDRGNGVRKAIEVGRWNRFRMREARMGNAAVDLSADDVWPIAKRLAPEERARLARLLLDEPPPEQPEDVEALRRAAFGRYKGRLWIADDFDAPLPPEIQRYFDGEDDDDEPVTP